MTPAGMFLLAFTAPLPSLTPHQLPASRRPSHATSALSSAFVIGCALSIVCLFSLAFDPRGVLSSRCCCCCCCYPRTHSCPGPSCNRNTAPTDKSADGSSTVMKVLLLLPPPLLLVLPLSRHLSRLNGYCRGRGVASPLPLTHVPHRFLLHSNCCRCAPCSSIQTRASHAHINPTQLISLKEQLRLLGHHCRRLPVRAGARASRSKHQFMVLLLPLPRHLP
jgi:hypothetical protein